MEGQSIASSTVNMLGTKVAVKHAFGCHAPRLDGVQAYAAPNGGKDYSDRLVYKIGKQVCIFDPETGKQDYFEQRSRNVTDILHFCVSPNTKYLSVCETARNEKTGEASSHVCVYSLTTLNRLKTLTHTVSRPVICSTFCGDPKLIAGISDEPDIHMFVWLWEKEKLHKSIAISMSPTIIRSGPSNVLMLSTSGHGNLKFWHLSGDGILKHGNFLPVSKEQNERFLDHIWLQSNLGQHRMVALVDPDGHALAPPAAGVNSNSTADGTATSVGTHAHTYGGGINTHNQNQAKTRRQLVHIFEGTDAIAPAGSSLANAGIPPINMELKQTLNLRLEANCKMEKIVLHSKAFLLVGSMGLICQYERSDDKHEPYIESRRISLGDLHIKVATVYPSEEKLVMLTKSGRILTMPLDLSIDHMNVAKGGRMGESTDDSTVNTMENSIDSNQEFPSGGGKGSAGAHHGIMELTSGGYHNSTILSADLAFERPIMVSIAADSTARIWNYASMKCELVHYFRNDDPIATAIHSSGFQVLVSFKDRIRMYNVLMDKLKPYKETILKNCKCLKFSHGSQYWAAASAINVAVYDTKSFTQLMTFQGHMMTVVRLSWAVGDQVLFSAGMDGNVYGWPIAREGRIDVIAANNRSSAVLDIAVDGPNTTFFSSKNKDADASNNKNESLLLGALAIGDGDASGAGDGGNSVNSVTNPQSGDGHHHSNNRHSKNAGGGGWASGSSAGPENKALWSEQRSCLIISTLDGNMKLPFWSLDYLRMGTAGGADGGGANRTVAAIGSAEGTPLIPGLPAIAITALQLNSTRTRLYAGTSLGSLRVYTWPPSEHFSSHAHAANGHNHNGSHGHGHSNNNNNNNTHVSSNQSVASRNSVSGSTVHHSSYGPTILPGVPPFYELFSHSGPVIAIKLNPQENTVVSASADGSVYIHTIVEEGGSNSSKEEAAVDPFELSSDAIVQNSEVVLMSVEDIEDHVNEVVELQKMLNETRAKNEFQSRKLDSEHTEALKKLTEMHDTTLTKEKDSFEKQRIAFDRRIRELMSGIESKETDHVKVITELENKYEHKLADQLERYDMLSEKMQLLKQKCEGLLEAEKNNFHKQLSEVKEEARAREKRLKMENRRAIEDKVSNEAAFKEIVNQQEDEYEDELKQLIGAAESELVSERETILKLRTLVQTKNTKLDQLKKKLIELSASSKARLQLLNHERQEKQKLHDTIEHYKKNLVERENALAEKEKMVLELRSTTRTLENFRFVLDHRLQQLSSERGPITNHIEGLEKHISTMYEELVEEFNTKKSTQEASHLKDQKIAWIMRDLIKTRQSVREKEQFIEGFKREVGNLVSTMVVGKELEEAMKGLYKKFVRGEAAGKAFVKLSDGAMEMAEELMNDDDDRTIMSLDHSLGKGAPPVAGGGTALMRAHPGAAGAGADRGGGAGVGGIGAGGAGKVPTGRFLRDVEDALIEKSKEADRQKEFVEKQSNNLRHRLHTLKTETHLAGKRRLNENSKLLYECNELRQEVKMLHRQLDTKTSAIDVAERMMASLRDQLAAAQNKARRAESFRSRAGSGKSSKRAQSGDRSQSPTRPFSPEQYQQMQESGFQEQYPPEYQQSLRANVQSGVPINLVSGMNSNEMGKAMTTNTGSSFAGVGANVGLDSRWLVHNALVKNPTGKGAGSSTFGPLSAGGGKGAHTLSAPALGAGGEGDGGSMQKKYALSESHPNFGSGAALTGAAGKAGASELGFGPSASAPGPLDINQFDDSSDMAPVSAARMPKNGIVAGTRVGTPKGGSSTAFAVGSAGGSAGAARGGSRQIQLNLPRADISVAHSREGASLRGGPSVSTAGAAGVHKRGAVGSGGNVYVDKLAREVDSLAQQLDDSLRQRDLQRLELSKLRKQLMTMSGSFAGSGLLPAHSSSVISTDRERGSTPAALTNADLYGEPSETDRRDMRFMPGYGPGPDFRHAGGEDSMDQSVGSQSVSSNRRGQQRDHFEKQQKVKSRNSSAAGGAGGQKDKGKSGGKTTAGTGSGTAKATVDLPAAQPTQASVGGDSLDEERGFVEGEGGGGDMNPVSPMQQDPDQDQDPGADRDVYAASSAAVPVDDTVRDGAEQVGGSTRGEGGGEGGGHENLSLASNS